MKLRAAIIVDNLSLRKWQQIALDNTSEKIEIISRLQQEVFNNYPKKTKQLQKLAKKYLKGKVL